MHDKKFRFRPALAALAAGATIAIMAAPAAAQQPDRIDCTTNPLFQQQDFTIGTWDVYSGPNKSARVTIEKVTGGCGLYETWTPAEGRPRGHGRGLFAYSNSTKGWQYFWISDAADTSLMNGGLVAPGHMRYIEVLVTGDNKKRVNQWDLIKLPDGRIRERSLISDDFGENWQMDYDLYWTKVN